MATFIQRRLSEFPATDLIVGQTLANDATLDATIDARTADSVVVHVWSGRRNSSVPTRELRIMIRRTLNGLLNTQDRRFDVTNPAPTTAASQTTLVAAASAGATSITVAAAGTLAIGDTICISAAAGGTGTHQWAEIISVTGGTTFGLAAPLKSAMAQGDIVANLGINTHQLIEGGDQINVRINNRTGQPMAVRVAVEIRTGSEVVVN
jgi:uncharacterized protein YdeI (BOF family)